jgi:hypothetical protein
MASRGQSLTVAYVAWDTVANAGKTGNVGSHTLVWIKDGTPATPTNSPLEVDATNAPGLYSILLTATECTCNLGVLTGKSSTAGVVLIPVTISFEQLPTAAPGANGGVPTVNASNYVAGVQATVVLSSSERLAIADALLGRSVANVEASAAEHSLTTVVLAMLESSILGTAWTIKRTDGATTHVTKTVAHDANAQPITGVQ